MSNFPELDNWNPMEEDYKNPCFNSYNDMADSMLYDLTALYVKNIPLDLTEDTFVSVMSQNGRRIKRQRLFEPRKDFTSKIGLVSFTTEAEAQDALNSLNKKPPYGFQIQYAKNKSKEIKNYLNPWWSVECEEARSLKKKAGNKYRHKNNAQNYEALQKACRFFRNVQRKCFRAYEGSVPTFENTKDTSTNEALTPVKKLSFGRGIGLVKEVSTHQNLRVVVEGKKRTAFHKSPEEEVKPVPRLVPYPFPLCLLCKKQAFHMCETCKQFYCSRECQENDWPKHQEICMPADSLIKKDLPKSVSNKGVDSSYMSDSSDAERSSEYGDQSQENISRKKVNLPQTNSRDTSLVKRTPLSNGGDISRDSSRFQKAEVIKINDLKESSLPLEGKVSVCSISSPSCFWIQLEEAKSILCEMEKSMSSASLKKADCSVNDVCLVNHKSKYHRVQIMKVMPTSALISFIDSGGTCTLPLNQIYRLPEGLKKYPIQALCCNLVDSPTDKNVHWSQEQSAAFKSFALDKVFNVHVHGCSNKVHDVSLFNDEGVSVFSVISLLHFQESDQDSGNKCSDIPNAWTDIKKNTDISIIPFEIHNDRFYGMVISDESAQTVQAIEEELLTTMQNKENINFRAKAGDIAVGSSSEYGFYRCVVVNKLKSSVLVHSIDYGNQDEVPVLHELPSNLLQKKTYVVCCEKPSSFSPEKFKKMFPSQGLISCSVKCVNSSYKELETQKGSEVVAFKCYPWYHAVLEESPKIPTKPLLPLPKKVMKGAITEKEVSPGVKYKVKVVFYKTPSEVYVQFETDESDIIRLSQNLHKFCNLPSNKVSKYIPDIDEMVACKFSEDGNWYRGQVLKKSGNLYKILFIDYGNESDVSDLDIKPLSDDLLHSKLSLSVCLQGVKNEDLTTDLLTKLCNEVWEMQVINKYPVQVMLFQGQKSLFDFLKKKSLLSSLTFQKLPAKGPVDIQITFADSDHLYVQMQKDLKQIESLTEKLNLVEKKAVSSKALLNHVYCGLFSDGLWYRISIEKELGNNKFLVNFIDFGNKDEIQVKDLRELPEELLEYPVFCVSVAAQNLDSTLQLQKTYSVKVTGEKNGVQEVKFCTGTNLLTKVSSLKKQTFDVGKEIELLLCHVEEDTYYSHTKSTEKVRESMESDLRKASDFTDVSNLPEVGDLLCAKCSDGVWYRGSVVGICSPDSCKICFIDYGNTEVVTRRDMKVLPPSLCSLPTFSIPLKVTNINVLQEQLSSGDNLFKAKVLDVNENVTIVEVLKPKNTIKPDIKPQVLPSTPVDVVVCYKEKERYFVQKFSDLKKISEMTLDFHSSPLQEAISGAQVGDIFCVKYEDVLYRGLVKAVLGKDRYNIYFIDYGNTDIINKSDMFALPSAYSTISMFCIPIQLDRASLSNPLEVNCQYSVKYTGKMNGESHIVTIISPESPILCSSLKEPLLQDFAEVSFLSFDNAYHYVRKSSDIEEYKRMQSVLDGLNCEKIVHIPSVNEVFLVKCEDLKLRRGCIKDSNEALGQYVVNIIDLGTTVNISARDLFYVPIKVRTFPNFTVKVKVSPTSPPVTVGETCNVRVIEKTAGVPVIAVIKTFLFKDLEHQCLPEGELRKVIFFHKEGNTLYLQDNSNIQQIAEIQAKVNSCAGNTAFTHTPVEGELLSARSAADGVWYRASVTQVLPCDKFQVLFIDYGNNELISKESLQPLSENLMSIPSAAIAVKVVQPMDLDIEFEKEYEVVALSRPLDGVQNVKIQLDNSSKPAIPNSKKFYLRDCNYIPFSSGEQEVVVYYVNSLDHFYCAPFENLGPNFHLTSEMTKYCQDLGIDRFDGDSEPEIGELVIAKFEDLWYRAAVVAKSPPLFDVIFPDYGNSLSVNIKECRKMVDTFMNLPIQSHKCQLSGFVISQGKEEAVALELKNYETVNLLALVEDNGGNKKIYIPSITDHLVEKKLAIRQD